MWKAAPVSSLVLIVLTGCGGNRPSPRQDVPEYRPVRSIVLAYDANNDGTVTRAELEQGLRAEFAKADANRKGCLDAEEARAVNQERWQKDQSTYSPLVDFKGDGCIDFSEFAAQPRSLFEQMDANGDGKVTPEELQPRGVRPPG
jgi:Ca2+-binding EF-hand superfamily protein